jgi:hypothetical protein
VFAVSADNPTLADDLKRCALHLGPHLLPETVDVVCRFAKEEIDWDAPAITLSATVLSEAGADLTLVDRRALLFAKAGSRAPSTLTPVVLGGMEELFSPAGMVELVVFMGVMQLFHRLYMFFLDPRVASKSTVGEAEAASNSSRRHQDPSAVVSSVRPESPVVQDQAAGSAIVREPNGGRLVLRGAEPISMLDVMSQRPVIRAPNVAGDRQHIRRNYVPRVYVEEDTAGQSEDPDEYLPRGQRRFVRAASSTVVRTEPAVTESGAVDSLAGKQPSALDNKRSLSLDEFGDSIPRRTSGNMGAGDLDRSTSTLEDSSSSAMLQDRRSGSSSSRPGGPIGSLQVRSSARHVSPGNFRGTVVSGGVVVGVERGSERILPYEPHDLSGEEQE